MKELLPVILPTLISCFTTLAVCLINNSIIRKDAEAKQNESIKLVTYQINDLAKKVGEHNNLVSRMYEVEKKTSIVEEQIKVANHRIDDLEHGHQ